MINLPPTLENDILSYCKLNNILNTDFFILKMIRQGFNIEKYGNNPPIKINSKKNINIEEEPIIEILIEDKKEEPIIEKKKNIYGE